MDVKRWKVVIGSDDCPHTSSINMCLLYETDINLSNEHLMDCTHENCPAKLTRPDPAEVERAINHLIDRVIRYGDLPVSHEIDKARSDLLKLVGS
jgi:hypothetical protein